MPTVQIDLGILRELLGRRDALVQAITAGVSEEKWDPVMRAFDDLLAAFVRLEDSVGPALRP